MKRIYLFAMIMLSYSSIADINVMTPKIVLENIHDSGAKKYIHDLAKENAMATSTSQWEAIVKGLSTGEAEWLQIVPLIARYTDAGFAEDLATALAQALPKNVAGVMNVLDEQLPPVSIGNVCSMPLYNETVPEQNEYVVKAIQALYKNDTPQAKECLRQLIKTVGKAGPFRRVD
ncbi:hypothetical protein CI789_21530 [Erwinia persicina]|uniref:hypothetical protein n=2 Tax=Erwinia persicina TaxID=55211 RepID=UPI000E4C422B|nr:hypothetical protein [Erwinia persicina]AXU97546.1 hypothetical protein CI789_21530 [Erwinia persicina]QZQ50760.1 hypothetical protein K6L24_02810 [Erwinia persicina]UTX13468.1 hypothetical protein NOG67_02830 [Erwinia persicina]